MEYQESTKNLNDTEEELAPDMDLVEEDVLFTEALDPSEEPLLTDPRASEKTKEKSRQNARHSLGVRRAIEEYLEKTRLRKELDYLFDDK